MNIVTTYMKRCSSLSYFREFVGLVRLEKFLDLGELAFLSFSSVGHNRKIEQ
jgi:hypothetical protein